MNETTTGQNVTLIIARLLLVSVLESAPPV